MPAPKASISSAAYAVMGIVKTAYWAFPHRYRCPIISLKPKAKQAKAAEKAFFFDFLPYY
jgi:hypothetical protein